MCDETRSGSRRSPFYWFSEGRHQLKIIVASFIAGFLFSKLCWGQLYMLSLDGTEPAEHCKVTRQVVLCFCRLPSWVWLECAQTIFRQMQQSTEAILGVHWSTCKERCVFKIAVLSLSHSKLQWPVKLHTIGLLQLARCVKNFAAAGVVTCVHTAPAAC